MKTIQVAFNSGENGEAPDELESTVTAKDIQTIKDVVNVLWSEESKVFSVNINVQLFVPIDGDNDWAWDINYVTAYLPINGKMEDVSLYQYYQNKYDAKDSIESEGISLGELEGLLEINKYQVFIDVPQDELWDDIKVEEMIVEAKTCIVAEQKAIEEAVKLYGDCYVWIVKEEDKLNKPIFA